jgi:Na+-driven multidrug efflux pump
MLIFGFVNIVNMTASSVLAYGIGPFPRWGIDGIVAGTLIARYTGLALLLMGMAGGVGGLKLIRRELRIRGETVRRILRIGAPAALDGAITWTGHFLFLLIIGHLAGGQMNSVLLAAHMIGVRVEAITYLPAGAWGMASAAIVGQSLGARDLRRAVGAGHEATRQCLLLGAVISFVFFFGAGEIYSLMHDDQAVRAAGAPAFRLLALFQIPLMASIVYLMSLRGAGETRYPLLVTIIAMFGFRLPVAYVCGIVLQGGLIGAWMGMYADMTVRGILATLRYRRGSWVETAV